MIGFRYFVIPRFNPSYNIDKLKDLKISKISSIHARYQEGKLCVVLVHTFSNCLEKQVREGFQQVSTSRSYINIIEQEANSTTLYLLSTYIPLQKITGVKNLLNTFSKGNYKITPSNNNTGWCIYWRIEFKSLNFAKHAINFIPNIPFENGKTFLSSSPFDIPLIQFNESSLIQNFLSKSYCSVSVEFPNKALLSSKKNITIVLAKNNITAKMIVSETNHEIYKGKPISCQYFIDSTFMKYLFLYITKVESSSSITDIRDFYDQMKEIGPVYQVYEDEEPGSKSYKVIFQSPKTLRKLFSNEKYTCSFPEYSIYTIYNFAPNSTEKNISTYLEKADLAIVYIETCSEKSTILPRFRVFIKNSEEEKFLSFFKSSNCIYRNVTRPFCVKFMHEKEFEASNDDTLSSMRTIQVPSNPNKTINDVFNEYSRFGIINLIFLDTKLSRYSITYNEDSQYLNAKKFLDANFPSKSTIVVNKEKKASLIITKNSNSIQITRSQAISLPFLMSSDDENSQYSNKMTKVSSSTVPAPKDDGFGYLPPPQKGTDSSNTSKQNNLSRYSSQRFIKKKLGNNKQSVLVDNEDGEEDEGDCEEIVFVPQRPTIMSKIFFKRFFNRDMPKKEEEENEKSKRKKESEDESESESVEYDDDDEVHIKQGSKMSPYLEEDAFNVEKISKRKNARNHEVQEEEEEEEIEEEYIVEYVEEEEEEEEYIEPVKSKSKTNKNMNKYLRKKTFIEEEEDNIEVPARTKNKKSRMKNEVPYEDDEDNIEAPARTKNKKSRMKNEVHYDDDDEIEAPVISKNKKSRMKNEFYDDEEEEIETPFAHLKDKITKPFYAANKNKMANNENDEDDEEITFAHQKSKNKFLRKKMANNANYDDDNDDDIYLAQSRLNRRSAKKIIDDDDDDDDEIQFGQQRLKNKSRKSQKDSSTNSSSAISKRNRNMQNDSIQEEDNQANQFEYDDDENDDSDFVMNGKNSNDSQFSHNSSRNKKYTKNSDDESDDLQDDED
ncbi:hypothetical protein M9Y10_031461 [Tritrichomonas musculus]|uniref:RRM domain-containing protein n=1 Tax=Tritrichomonas musculus TaxID=1915356 RepID=A0ABR2H0U2_9EUKA